MRWSQDTHRHLYVHYQTTRNALLNPMKPPTKFSISVILKHIRLKRENGKRILNRISEFRIQDCSHHPTTSIVEIYCIELMRLV